MREDLRLIDGFTDYFITSEGAVYSLKTNRFLVLETDKSGYQRVKLRGKNIKIHRAVAEAFFGPSPLDVNHIDGNKKNNAVSNLEYVTRSQNTKHARATGLHQGTRLSDGAVRVIKVLMKDWPLRKVADNYGVSTRCIQHIRNGTTWSHIT